MNNDFRHLWSQKKLIQLDKSSADVQQAVDWLGSVVDAITLDITAFSGDKMLISACESTEDRALIRDGFLARCVADFFAVTGRQQF